MFGMLRPLMIVPALLMIVTVAASSARAGQPQARQTFSIRVPGKVEVSTVRGRTDGTPAAVRVTATERVEVTVEHQPAVSSKEHQPAVSSKPVPVLRSRLTLPGDSLTIPATQPPLDLKSGVRSTVVITVVPL